MNGLQEAIFREYDIRGIADSELPNQAVQAISAAAAAVFVREKKQTIVVGRDGRPSSQRIRDVVTETLASYGLTVIDIGVVPTPVVYFAVFHHDLDGAMVITASHNPGEYNGLKVMVGKAALYGDAIRELYRLACAGNFAPLKSGRVEIRDIIPAYLEYVQTNVTLKKPLRVVIDAGNGTAGLTAGELYRRLGAEVTELFCQLDGTFPNHHPDPTQPDNLKDIIAKVHETKADLGIAFDGDADRIGAVDGLGRILWGDQLMVIFARDILLRHPGATVISEVKASEVLYSEIRRLGGVPIMWKAGHSLIKQKIFQENALLAGEVSGHIFFHDKWFGFDDAVYAGARLLEVLSRKKETLAEIRDSISPAFNTPELRVDASDEAKFRIVAAVQEHFRSRYPVNEIDGARITFPHGWALVRASNTQPALVVRFEADSRENLDQIRRTVEEALTAIRKAIGV